MIPPIPYKGEQPDIFVSYAHKDSAKVWPIIRQMQQDGYRVWYDEGIDPGTEWDENIAAHVSGCSYFIAFISRNYLSSDNCKDEMNYARDLEKKQVLVYLEDVKLPKGMALRSGRLQSFKADKRGFFSELYTAEGIQEVTDVPFAGTGQRSSKKRNFFWILPAAAALACAFAWFLWKPAEQEATESLSAEPVAETAVTEAPEAEVSEEEVPATAKEQELLTFQQTAFISDEVGIRVIAQKLCEDEDGNLILKVLTENTGSQDRTVTIHSVSLNGVECAPGVFVDTYANSVTEEEISWRAESLAASELDFAGDMTEIRVIEGYYQIDMGEGQATRTGVFLYYPYGAENALFYEYIPDEDDQLLTDQEDYQLVLTDWFLDEDGVWTGEFVCRNLSDRHIQVSLELENLEGCEYAVYHVAYLYPGRDMKYRMAVDDWQYEQQGRPEQISGWTSMWDTKAREWTGPQTTISLHLAW